MGRSEVVGESPGRCVHARSASALDPTPSIELTFILWDLSVPAVLFAKACELFITELTIRSYCYAENGAGAGGAKRKTLTREDVSTAVQKTDIFDFLVGE